MSAFILSRDGHLAADRGSDVNGRPHNAGEERWMQNEKLEERLVAS